MQLINIIFLFKLTRLTFNKLKYWNNWKAVLLHKIENN